MEVRKSKKWTYKVMGSKDKKTQKAKYYTVEVTDHKITDCSCPGRGWRPYSPCKHMKRLHEMNPTQKL